MSIFIYFPGSSHLGSVFINRRKEVERPLLKCQGDADWDGDCAVSIPLPRIRVGRTRKYMSGPCSVCFNLKAAFPHNSLQSKFISIKRHFSVSLFHSFVEQLYSVIRFPFPSARKQIPRFSLTFQSQASPPNTVSLSSILVIEQDTSRTKK